jgi:DNA-binding transcriptional MerR regulator
MAEKAPGAFKTIGELSAELGVAQHILRYWESKFPQLRPLQRAGNRRYYRPADVELTRRIHRLLNEEGYTIRGVQKVLRSPGADEAPAPAQAVEQQLQQQPQPIESGAPSRVDVERLMTIRDRLASALYD